MVAAEGVVWPREKGFDEDFRHPSFITQQCHLERALRLLGLKVESAWREAFAQTLSLPGQILHEATRAIKLSSALITKAPDPITLALVTTAAGDHTHLEVCSEVSPNPSATLSERALLVLQNAAKPLSLKSLRDTLKVNNQRLGNALEALEKQGIIVNTTRGWAPVRSRQALQQAVD